MLGAVSAASKKLGAQGREPTAAAITSLLAHPSYDLATVKACLAEINIKYT